jgi:hypothetical protein
MLLLAGLFLSSNAELSEILPGWKHAAPLLEEPVAKELIHPLTGESLGTVQTRVNPEQPLAAADAAPVLDTERLHQFDDLGDLDISNIKTLAEIVMGWSSQDASDEVYGRGVNGPSTSDLVILELPPALLTRLATSSSNDIARFGSLWSEKQREDAATVESPWLREQLQRIPEAVWQERLGQLVRLAVPAQSSDRGVYLLLSP